MKNYKDLTTRELENIIMFLAQIYGKKKSNWKKTIVIFKEMKGGSGE